MGESCGMHARVRRDRCSSALLSGSEPVRERESERERVVKSGRRREKERDRENGVYLTRTLRADATREIHTSQRAFESCCNRVEHSNFPNFVIHECDP